MQLRAALRCAREVRERALLRIDEACHRLVERDEVVARRERRKAPADLRRVEHFVREPIRLRGGEAAGDDVAVRRADHQPAGEVEQRWIELAPQLIRAQEQRHVVRAFEVRLADDARASVARAAVVRGRETLDADHLRAARCEMGRGCAAHPAEADHDDLHGAQYVESPPECPSSPSARRTSSKKSENWWSARTTRSARSPSRSSNISSAIRRRTFF